MKTIRSRMLVVVTAAAIVVSLFVHWDEVEKGALDGWNYGMHSLR